MPGTSRLQLQRVEAKFNVTTDYPNLSLHSACSSGNLGLVKYAITHGQPVNSSLDGVLPLHAACAGGNEDVVRYLLDEAKADVNVRRLPRRYSNDRFKSCALQGGLSVGASGSTPLHFAAANGHVGVIMVLLLHGALVGMKDKYGITPEKLAMDCGWVECAEVLRTWSGPVGTGAGAGEREMEKNDEQVYEDGEDVDEHEHDRELIGYPGFPAGSKRLHVKKSIDSALHLLRSTGSGPGIVATGQSSPISPGRTSFSSRSQHQMQPMNSLLPIPLPPSPGLGTPKEYASGYENVNGGMKIGMRSMKMKDVKSAKVHVGRRPNSAGAGAGVGAGAGAASVSGRTGSGSGSGSAVGSGLTSTSVSASALNSTIGLSSSSSSSPMHTSLPTSTSMPTSASVPVYVHSSAMSASASASVSASVSTSTPSSMQTRTNATMNMNMSSYPSHPHSISTRSLERDKEKEKEKDKEKRLGHKYSLRGLFKKVYGPEVDGPDYDGGGAAVKDVLDREDDEDMDKDEIENADADAMVKSLAGSSKTASSSRIGTGTSSSTKIEETTMTLGDGSDSRFGVANNNNSNNVDDSHLDTRTDSRLSIFGTLEELDALLSPLEGGRESGLGSAVELHYALGKEDLRVIGGGGGGGVGVGGGIGYTPVEAEASDRQDHDVDDGLDDSGVGVDVRGAGNRSLGKGKSDNASASASGVGNSVLRMFSERDVGGVSVPSPRRELQRLRFDDDDDGNIRGKKLIGLRGCSSIGCFRSYREMERRAEIGGDLFKPDTSAIVGIDYQQHEDGSTGPAVDNGDIHDNVVTAGQYAQQLRFMLDKPPMGRMRMRGQSFAESSFSSSPSPGLLTPDIKLVGSGNNPSASASGEFPFETENVEGGGGGGALALKESDTRYRGYSVSSTDSSIPGPISPPTRLLDIGMTTPPVDHKLKHSSSAYLVKKSRFFDEDIDGFDDDNEEEEEEEGLGSTGVSPTYSILRDITNPITTPARYVSNRAEALALVQRAEKEIIQSAAISTSPAESGVNKDLSSPTSARIPLSAQLAAYGEVLALERRFARGERQREQWSNRSDSEDDGREVLNGLGTPTSASKSVHSARKGSYLASSPTAIVAPKSPRRATQKVIKLRRPHTAEGRTTSSSTSFNRHAVIDQKDNIHHHNNRSLHGKSSSATSPTTLLSNGGYRPEYQEERRNGANIQIVETSATPQNTSPVSPRRTVSDNNTPSRHASLDVKPQHRAEPSMASSSIPLSRTATIPHPSGPDVHATTRDMRQSRSQGDSQKLTRMGVLPSNGILAPAISQSISSTFQTKHRFGGIKSLVQSFTGRS